MSAIFGFEERVSQGFIERGVVCLPHTPGGKLDVHDTVASIKNEDIVFIKHAQPSSLQVKAIGVVTSDFPVENDTGLCMPVEWVWLGKKEIDHFDEKLLTDDHVFYEEHDIFVQRELLKLLPEKYRLQYW